MIAFVLEAAIAVAVSVWVHGYAWWAPLVAFPLIMSIGSFMYSPPMPLSNQRRLMDALIMVVQIGWIGASAIICYRGFGVWWGAAIGLAIGWVTMGFFTPRRWAAEVGRDV